MSDTGVGVPPQERTKIFDRFYRGERSGQSPGHGLGLSIAETIANLHGFKLTVEDNNPGARFELRATSSAPAGQDWPRELGRNGGGFAGRDRNYILM